MMNTSAEVMPVSLLPSLLLAILLVGYTPGPANLFALHCSMKNGVRKALVMWLGLVAGFTVAAVIAAVVTHEVGVGHRDRYLDSLFRVDEPVPRDFCLPFFYYLIIYVL